MFMRVLVTDGMDASAVEKLRKEGYEVVEQFYEPDELGVALREFDAVIIRSATKIKEHQIDNVVLGKELERLDELAPLTPRLTYTSIRNGGRNFRKRKPRWVIAPKITRTSRPGSRRYKGRGAWLRNATPNDWAK